MNELKLNNNLAGFSTKSVECPICNTKFYSENIEKDAKKYIPNNINSDLREIYKQDENLIIINPIIYQIIICPECYYSLLKEDFKNPNKKIKKYLIEHTNKRKQLLKLLFTNINFKEQKTIEHGIIAYILAIDCYKFFDESFNPTVKKAICALRTSWLAKDMEQHYNNISFKVINKIFYRKATKYYSLALNYANNKKEPLNSNQFIGPDVNYNWGYHGILYLTGYLNYYFSEEQTDLDKKNNTLIKIKHIMAKLYKESLSNKNKFNPIMNFSKKLYDDINIKIENIKK